jgi:hypothetical protein
MDVKDEEEDIMMMQEVQQGRRGVTSLKIHYENTHENLTAAARAKSKKKSKQATMPETKMQNKQHSK